ncbi:MAG: ornithine carbamoyltransferase [SAR202 cluster bacterium]|nr:ornithine carbamoyltransferase [SAR202 cluster bacterium]|tara:strand:+ start:1990 stop:2877 length:888 start_codon:yes stop_codon:yes gene_type:complete
MTIKHLLSINDLNGSEISSIITRAISSKPMPYNNLLENETVGIWFEKPSLRTRLSFEIGVKQLGGTTIYLDKDNIGVGSREPIRDVANVISRYIYAFIARTFAHSTLTEFAKYSTIPIINALSDEEHPCQTLADLVTIQEKFGTLKNITIAYIGDGNNVARSLACGAYQIGMPFISSSPEEYKLTIDNEKINQSIIHEINPKKAMSAADVIYTDAWTSMGQEAESEIRKKAFQKYQISVEDLNSAKDNAILMHPLPAHHGEEISQDLLYHKKSVVFDQAENRLHAQRAAMEYLFK